MEKFVSTVFSSFFQRAEEVTFKEKLIVLSVGVSCIVAILGAAVYIYKNNL
jgi:hypothetical protein